MLQQGLACLAPIRVPWVAPIRVPWAGEYAANSMPEFDELLESCLTGLWVSGSISISLLNCQAI